MAHKLREVCVVHNAGVGHPEVAAGAAPALTTMLGAFVEAVADTLRAETEQVGGRTGASAAALTTVAQFPDRSVEFLRRAIGLSHSATVRVVDQLVADGLVERRRSGHGPAVAITPTRRGRERARAVSARRRQVLSGILAQLSPAEIDALASILDTTLAHLASERGTTICRLCDQQACRARGCPVVHRQDQLGVPPPPATPI